MHNDIDQRLIEAAVPPKRTTPWLVIAPAHHRFRDWCYEQGLNHRSPPIQAIYITHPRQLQGYDNLEDNLVILGYHRDTGGQNLREYVDAILAVQGRKTK